MSEYLHIVCLDAPNPPDYGGAIDMYYKIKALAERGKKIILHYFDYNPLRNANGLENCCVAIHAYSRKSILKALPLSRPFIVQSRISQDLIRRLNENNYPILLEGLHCSGMIPFINNQQRIVLRMHNEEAAYYHHLALTEQSVLKKQYFIQESKLLKRHQGKLDKKTKLACLSQTDMETFKAEYKFQEVHFIPCFIPWQKLNGKEGKGDYCLYHGNMTVSENEEAALWLIQHVFSKIDTPLIIAGKGISKRIKNSAGLNKNIQLVNQPSIPEIDELIRTAQINVLPSMNSTGVKLKLLNALLNGRYCLTNYNGVKGSKIERGVIIENDGAKWIQLIDALMQQNFTSGEIESRNEVLALYDNRQNATRLNALW